MRSRLRDLGTPQSLKVGPGTPLRFKGRTSGAPSKFKSGTSNTLIFFFFRIFFLFFLFCFFSFLNNEHNIRPSGLIGLSGEFICGLMGMTYTRKSFKKDSIFFIIVILSDNMKIGSQILTWILHNLRFT